MNFSQVEAGNGNLVTMIGTFAEVGGTTYTASQKAKALCKIRDDNGASHNVHIHQGKGELPGPQQLNQRCQFKLSTFQGNSPRGTYVGYSGFWDSRAQIAPQGGSTPQPQAPQGVAAAPQGDEPNRERTNRDERRFGLYQALVQAGVQPTALVADVKELMAIETLVDYSVKGIGGLKNPDYVGDDPPPPTDDGIPY